MSGRLRGLLLDNLLLKVISLGLALLLFAMVRGEKQSLAQGAVRLTYTVPTGKVLASELPSQLTIVVQGSATRMQRFRFEDLADAHIDLSTVRKGYLKFTEDLVQLPPGLKVTSIRPTGTTVRFESLAQRRVPVIPTVKGLVQAGYQVLGRTVKPTHLPIEGPRSLVQGIEEVATQPVSVEGASTSLVQRVALMPLPPRVRSIAETEVTVSVEVVPVSSELVLEAVPVEVLDPAGRAASVKPQQVQVTFTGPTTVLAPLRRARLVAWAELHHGAQGVLDIKPVIRGLPAGVTVSAILPGTVSVTIGEPEPAGGSTGR